MVNKGLLAKCSDALLPCRKIGIWSFKLGILLEMKDSTKRKTLILLGLVTIIMMIIATSLSQLELQPGMPLPKLKNAQIVATPIETESFWLLPVSEFFIVFIALLVAGTILHIVYRLLRGAEWKGILTFVWSMLIISVLVSSFLLLILFLPDSTGLVPVELPVPTPKPPVTAPLGAVPPVLPWLVGLGLLVAGILTGIWIFGSMSSRTRQMDVVGLEAEKAWQAIKTGLDLKSVIMKCYRQMSLALAEEQGIERKEFMTTREFEELLVSAGIPHEPVHQLTQLFEAVRYGNWQPNPADEQKAIHCLEAIVLSSREAKGLN